MLLLSILIVSTFARIHTQTSVTNYLVKRTSKPSLIALDQSQKLTAEEDEDYNNDHLMNYDDLRQNHSGVERPSKRQRANPANRATFPEYIIQRNLSTVSEVWQEYKYGIYGHPSVESIISAYGVGCLNSTTNISYYYNRKKIYDFITKAIRNSKSAVEVVNELENLRVDKKWTLSMLQDNIRLVRFDESYGKLTLDKPVFQLLRNLTSVYEVWQEYKYGLNGNPSVESIVKMSGTGWIKSQNERRFYNERCMLYDFILNATRHGRPDIEVVTELEQLRVNSKISLRKFQLVIGPSSVKYQNSQLPPTTPIYTMLRNLTTVAEVWQEYKYGINGNPSLSRLLEDLGTGWLHSKPNRLFYSRRKKIYDYIKKRVANSQSEETAINELEKLRIESNLSLYQLQMRIKDLTGDESRRNIPGYNLLRNITTVKELWQEFKYGVNGNPSVESLVEQYGTGWIKTEFEQAYFNGRKKIYHFMLSSIANGTAEGDVVKELDELRVSRNWSLKKLGLHISSFLLDGATSKLTSFKPMYELHPNLVAVPEVWNEYKYGINGGPSVESILQEYGTKFFNTNGDKSLFYRRIKICDYILNEIENGKLEEDAVQELEDFRISNHLSLFRLQENIRLGISPPTPVDQDDNTVFDEIWGHEMDLDEEALFTELWLNSNGTDQADQD